MINIIFFVPLDDNNNFETLFETIPIYASFIFDRFPARFRNVSVQFSLSTSYIFFSRHGSRRLESWEVFFSGREVGKWKSLGSVANREIGPTFSRVTRPIECQAPLKMRGRIKRIRPLHHSLLVNLYKCDNINFEYGNEYRSCTS